MAVPQKIRNRTEEVTAALKECRHLTLSERDDLIEIMAEACEGTNGLTVEDKTQANSVNLANLCYLVIRDKIEGTAAAGFWPLFFRWAERCSWQLVIIALGAFVLFGYRPEIVGAIKAIAGR